MKKFLAVILVIVALFSLTACGTEAYLKITAPGTYELQVFDETNKKQRGEYPVSKYLRVVSLGLGEGVKYISRAEAYGCERIGASIMVENPYVFPATYKDAKITVEVTLSYETYTSLFRKKSYVSDPVELEIELDENGSGSASFMIDPDPDVAKHTFFDGLVYYTSLKPAYAGVKISAITRITKASGTVTFYKKVDPTPTATPTTSPSDTVTE